jgi:SHS2 domain-containing protein
MVTISAKAEGETYSKEKHQTKVEVKAVTFHRMEIEKSNHVVVRYILDL